MVISAVPFVQLPFFFLLFSFLFISFSRNDEATLVRTVNLILTSDIMNYVSLEVRRDLCG